MFLELTTFDICNSHQCRMWIWASACAPSRWTAAFCVLYFVVQCVYTTNTWANTDAESLIISLQVFSHQSKIRRHSFHSQIIHTALACFLSQHHKNGFNLFFQQFSIKKNYFINCVHFDMNKLSELLVFFVCSDFIWFVVQWPELVSV